MQKKNPKTRCEKRQLSKSSTVCRFFSRIQSAYADELEKKDDIVEFRCNVLMDGLELGDYTSDFVCKKNDGTYMVRECVERKNLMRPLTIKHLDASLAYWRRHGIDDWGIVIEKEGESSDNGKRDAD